MKSMLDKATLIGEIKDMFFYEKRFTANQIAPRGHESAEVGNFFAGKTNSDITYEDMLIEAKKEVALCVNIVLHQLILR